MKAVVLAAMSIVLFPFVLTRCHDSRPQAPSVPAVAASHEIIALTDVTVIDPSAAQPQPNMTVVLRDGLIAALGSVGAVEIPPGAVRIDGTGRFLIPGLWDAHAHLSYPGECALPILIAHGVTSVRDLGGPPGEGIAWRREIAERRRIGPRLFLVGLNMESASWMNAVERMIRKSEPDADIRIRRLWEQSPRFKVSSKRDARSAVDTAQRLGMSAVKFRNLAGGEFRAIAREARRRGIPVAGHAPREISLAETAEAGLGSLEHAANLSSLATLPVRERAEQYKRIARSGMFVTPTLVSDGMWAPDSLVLTVLADTARMLSPQQIEMWRDVLRDRRNWSTPVPRHVHDSTLAVMVASVREAYRAGVPLLAGTDLGTLLTFPGSSLHEELALLVERVGLSPMEALRSATVLPARFFGVERELGGISAGKHADLVLLRADPLRDIRNLVHIEGVIQAGRYFGPKDIAALQICKAPIITDGADAERGGPTPISPVSGARNPKR
jgi:imidazolonepropionase-like amidohydrolase